MPLTSILAYPAGLDVSHICSEPSSLRLAPRCRRKYDRNSQRNCNKSWIIPTKKEFVFRIHLLYSFLIMTGICPQWKTVAHWLCLSLSMQAGRQAVGWVGRDHTCPPIQPPTNLNSHPSPLSISSQKKDPIKPNLLFSYIVFFIFLKDLFFPRLFRWHDSYHCFYVWLVKLLTVHRYSVFFSLHNLVL